jgi:hypothetical protein
LVILRKNILQIEPVLAGYPPDEYCGAGIGRICDLRLRRAQKSRQAIGENDLRGPDLGINFVTDRNNINFFKTPINFHWRSFVGS